MGKRRAAEPPRPRYPFQHTHTPLSKVRAHRGAQLDGSPTSPPTPLSRRRAAPARVTQPTNIFPSPARRALTAEHGAAVTPQPPLHHTHPSPRRCRKAGQAWARQGPATLPPHRYHFQHMRAPLPGHRGSLRGVDAPPSPSHTLLPHPLAAGGRLQQGQGEGAADAPPSQVSLPAHTSPSPPHSPRRAGRRPAVTSPTLTPPSPLAAGGLLRKGQGKGRRRPPLAM
jgi:hypothetical protein